MVALRSALVTLAILLGLGLALAQTENLAGPQQKAEQEKAQHSKPGQAGTTEPSAETPTTKPNDTAVFVDGRLVVPGAPADSQTVPSIVSKRNAGLDALPTMAFPLPLTDDQRQRIRDAVAKAPVADTNAHAAEVLPSQIEVRDLPDQITAAIPAVRNLSYVRTSNGVLLVIAPNRVVVGEIKN